MGCHGNVGSYVNAWFIRTQLAEWAGENGIR